jgi:DNA polymerase elongation subunit (family B)
MTLRSALIPLPTKQENDKLTFNLQKIVVKTMDYQKNIWLFGVDPNGLSTAVKIIDFQPTFMMRSVDHWDAEDEVAADELLDFIEEINTQNAHHGSSEKIKYGEFVYMSPFIGFTNRRQDRMVKFVCNNINDAITVIKYLKDNKYTLYHDDFEYENQFLQQTNFAYQEWLTIEPLRAHTSKHTHCCIEGYGFMENIVKCPDMTQNPNTLKAFLRFKAVSRDGVIDNKPSYKPNPNLPYDRLIAMGVSYVWSNSLTGTAFREVVHTIIPENSHVVDNNTDRKIEYRVYNSEKDMLEGFRLDLIEYDPDDVFYFPDEFQTLNYYSTRVMSQGSTTGLKLERFKNSKIRTFKNSNVITNSVIETRCIFNMEAALQKKVFISIESYDLYTCSCHKKLRKNARKWDELLRDNDTPNKVMKSGPKSRSQIFHILLQDMQLLVDLEKDTSMRMEYSNVSKASDTDLTDIVSRGEQIRVFNKLTHFCMENQTYINREKLAQKPLRFRITERPPTFVDPPDLELNLNLRTECAKYLQEKLQYHKNNKAKKPSNTSKQMSIDEFMTEEKLEDDEDDAETKKHAKDDEEAEGGNVMKPACKFWDEELVFIDDFASLYPSIMMAFNLSYENLVYDQTYMDLPGVEYFFIPVNKYETVASANMIGIFPKMLRQFVDNRAAIKKKMKNEKDPFKKNMYDHEQNSMKVLCNGTYGFCGAEKRGALLAVKAIMYMVTALGRYLQKFCCNYVGTVYNMPCIYGDSVTGDTPILCRLNGQIFYRTIDNLPGQGNWFRDREKEGRLPVKGLEVWNDTGFTPLQNIIRHKTDKKIYRILTYTGCVCVTEDHSLLTPEAKIVKPEQVKTGHRLLHHDLPKIGGNIHIPCAFSKGLFYARGVIENNNVWQLSMTESYVLKRAYRELIQQYPNEKFHLSIDEEKIHTLTNENTEFVQDWQKMFRDCENQKQIPPEIYTTDTRNIALFLSGFEATSWNMTPLDHAIRYLFRSTLKGRIVLENHQDMYEIGPFYETNTGKSLDEIKSIEEIPRTKEHVDYVYDLTTENHHFSAGIGRMVVHNTDSIFKLMPLYKTKDGQQNIEELCQGMGQMYKMQDYFGKDQGFTWQQVVEHYKKKPIPKGYDKPVDPSTFSYKHQIHCMCYLICEKICAELTKVINRPPVELNFENMATKVWMGWVKKYYAFLGWQEEDPSKTKYIKITGMPVKTRSWSPWTRNVLMGVTERMMYDKTHEIPNFLTRELDLFIEGKVPIRELMISKGYKNKAAYKHFRQPHLQALLKIEKRTRSQVKEKSRIYFVVLKGNDKLYLRTETPDFAAEQKLELDLEYYLKNQFEKPMRKLLTYHPHLLNFEVFYSTYMKRLKMKSGNMMDITDFQTSSLGKRQLTGEEVIAKRRKIFESKKETKHKNVVIDDSNDPFVKLLASQKKITPS